MKYTLNKTLNRDFAAIQIGDLAPRAYFIPFSTKEKLMGTDYRRERYGSDRVVCLSGEWDFKFYKDGKLPDVFDSARVKFDKIHVPSTWQRTGYLEPVYLNCPYENTVKAPDLPDKMPAGVYRKIFNIADASKTYILTFLGVANHACIYVNGSFVGYREGSHNTTEYDITPYIKEGDNELLVSMYKWCTGTFLEAQDMFRENGIFRDVLLYTYDKNYIYDYKIVSTKQGKTFTLDIDVNIKGAKGCELEIAVVKGGETVGSVTVPAKSKTTAKLAKLPVNSWNAEIPDYYEIYFTLKKGDTELETVRQLYGFRTIEIKDKVYFFNGKKVKMKGVNHHDTHLTKGYAMGLDDLERDVRLMKQFNVNCVRTSHYPPDPFFFQLATAYGIYVMDESDIETHGCGDMFDDVSHLSMDLAWAPRYVDRVRHTYFRDRNNGCIAMWSLGNESGGYLCQDKCYKFFKSQKSDIPVFYEGVSGTRRFAYDVSSEMYTSVPELHKMAKGEHKRTYSVKGGKDLFGTRPFFMCEYAHAMGVGPGNLEEYMQTLYKYDFMMGACVWEWADHTVLHENDKYKYRYTYGGDHGEKRHDGHFCVDGLFYSDRRPHTGALEMKNVYRPVRAELQKGGKVKFTNHNRFREASYLVADWALLIGGKIVKNGELTMDIAPQKSKVFELPLAVSEQDDAFLNISYFDGTELVAEESIAVNEYICAPASKAGRCKLNIEKGDDIKVYTKNFSVTVGADGLLKSYISGGRELLNTEAKKAAMSLNITRAYIDNDASLHHYMDRSGISLDDCKTSADVSVSEVDDTAVITSRLAVSLSGKYVFDVVFSYIINKSGDITVSEYLENIAPDDVFEIDRLPRVGFMLELPRSVELAKYYGLGECENMPDYTAQALMGIYEDKIENMYEPYVYPQESGMHTAVRFAEFTDNSGNGIGLYASNVPFAFSAHHFTQELIAAAGHQEDVHDENTTVISVDTFTRGIGSSSCGPDTLDEYKYSKANRCKLSSITVKAIKKG